MANQSYNTCPLPEPLRYYIVRGNDMIPLIPIDQLPNEYRPVGLPAKLGHRQMSGEKWKFVAETSEAPHTLAVALPTATSLPHRITPSSSRAPDPQPHAKPSPEPEKTRQHGGHSGEAPITESDTQGLSQSIHSSAAARPKPVAHTANAVHQNSQRDGNYNVPSPSGIVPRPAKKVYCTHWIQHNACTYAAIGTGCKYKHEMPNLATLRKLGLNEYPRWWKILQASTRRRPAQAGTTDNDPTRRVLPGSPTSQNSRPRAQVYTIDDTKAPAKDQTARNSRESLGLASSTMATNAAVPNMQDLIDFDDGHSSPTGLQQPEPSSPGVASAPTLVSGAASSPPRGLIRSKHAPQW